MISLGVAADERYEYVKIGFRRQGHACMGQRPYQAVISLGGFCQVACQIEPRFYPPGAGRFRACLFSTGYHPA